MFFPNNIYLFAAEPVYTLEGADCIKGWHRFVGAEITDITFSVVFSSTCFLPFATLGFTAKPSNLPTPPISAPSQPPTAGLMPCIIYWFPCQSPRGPHGTHYSAYAPSGDFAISACPCRTIPFPYKSCCSNTITMMISSEGHPSPR